MSDFVSGFWSVWISVIAIAGVIGCGILLWVQSKARETAVGGQAAQTMGHVWDETLQEFNNPLPRWWSWMFYITVFFALGYLAAYPGLGSFPGLFGWTSRGQYEGEMKQAEEQYAPIFARFQAQDIPALAANAEARQMGERLFHTYCSQCHGSDARGARGFPNLTDNDWLYGGAPEQIEQTILDGRQGVMPPHAHLGEETVRDLVNYVRSLSSGKLSFDAARAERGKAAFNTVGCTACHGPDAKGNQAVGAPNLTDSTWLYGSSEATLTETISKGRTNRMPAHKDFLGEAKVHLLAAYVYSLSHGEAAAK
ncbi:MAG TPA: cytochrome-c oxidase, cbb3-type subunit III [Candidatus Desulfobacillus sp.]|nr:cytochrome-c oxidase, cbb3-type subunit III [Candidatus Desulfobacillus sp.]